MFKNETITKVSDAIQSEYNNSLQTYGMRFASNKEAYNAMLSELDEAMHELGRLQKAKEELYAVAHNEGDAEEEIHLSLTAARTSALFGALELIQVAAILQKWDISRD